MMNAWNPYPCPVPTETLMQNLHPVRATLQVKPITAIRLPTVEYTSGVWNANIRDLWMSQT